MNREYSGLESNVLYSIVFNYIYIYYIHQTDSRCVDATVIWKQPIYKIEWFQME